MGTYACFYEKAKHTLLRAKFNLTYNWLSIFLKPHNHAHTNTYSIEYAENAFGSFRENFYYWKFPWRNFPVVCQGTIVNCP